ncbi:hypothetical protein BC936DRAFT_141535 [Jimgerdemannia flammicorona]|uniref:Uncharacterized protein n=1 Tax=Jimgerdemannia flammicorona TaxID=994334 RepID=A0A433DG58_9FUNG|nr:hypothetical protein BC936DRAFT_141535 [Jimgerdemannia flammicorona]
MSNTTILFIATTLLSDPPTSGLFNKCLRILLLAIFLFVAKDYPSWRERNISSQHTTSSITSSSYTTTDPTTTTTTNRTTTNSTTTDPTTIDPTTTTYSTTIYPTTTDPIITDPTATDLPTTTINPTTTNSTTTSSITTGPITTTGPTTTSSQPSQKSSEPHKLWFLLFLPFVLLYLVVRVAWELFRLGVFTFLQVTEWTVKWTSIAFGRFAIHVITEWLPRVIQEIGVLLDERFLPEMKLLAEKFKEYGLPASVRWCEDAFRWIVYFYRHVEDYMSLTEAKLFQFWTDIVRPLSGKTLTWAIFWMLDLLTWIVTRGIYLSPILYEAATRLAIALWKDAIAFWDDATALWKAAIALWKAAMDLAGVAAKAWNTVLVPSAIYIGDKIVQAWKLAIVTTPHLARFICEYVLLPTVKHAWEILTGPTMQKLLIDVYNHLVSEATQQYLIGLCKRLTASAMFWAQKNIRTFIFFVEWTQRMANLIITTYHWTHQHSFLPLFHFFPDLYKRLMTAFSDIYTRCSFALLSATTFIVNVLRSIIPLCDFIYTHFTHPVVMFLYDTTVLIITDALTHARPLLSHLLATSSTVYTWIETVSYLLFANYAHPAYTVVQARAAAVAVFVAENAGPALSRAIDATDKAYERLAPRIVEIKEKIAHGADLLVVWVGDILMEWVKRETQVIGDTTDGADMKAKVE